MLFDTHIHIFPEKLKGKVLPKLSEISGSPYYSDGTLEDTQKKLGEYGCTHALTLHIATNPRQESSVNSFAIESQGGNIYSFGSVHPLSPNALTELDRIKAAGLKGVKFHPDYQEFFADSEIMEPIYKSSSDLGLIVAFHAGRDPYSPGTVHCTPKALAAVAKKFPTMTIIAAHMGGMDMADDVEKYLVGKPNVYFDTAFASKTHTSRTLERLIRLHGVDKILFATDFPWSTPEVEKQLIEGTNLTQEEKDKIYFLNAFKLLNVDTEREHDYD